ncbi:hypothetical protein P0136_04840 [Lentisphaerota bacterium ZTH]|nr:hypothetical protein JYG24_04040 [Lentisphaerota bacterium]WET07316.1 hypothetical protein P0136_04840 [Lentisphaerota bacterium ZTH]
MPNNAYRTTLENIALDRLIKTFRPQTSHNDHTNQLKLEALRRVIALFYYSSFKICGQPPDIKYSIGEYFIHGGRILFDLSELPRTYKNAFRQYILLEDKQDSPVYSRPAATHDIITIDGVGEKKLSFMESASGTALNIFNGSIIKGETGHWGIDLAIGGAGNKVTELGGTRRHTVKGNGNYGHMYIFCKGQYPEAAMTGLEEAAPGKTNRVSGDNHGLNGKGGHYSACIADKLGNMQSDNSFDEGFRSHRKLRSKMSTPKIDLPGGEYNWNSAIVSKFSFLKAVNSKITVENAAKYLLAPHPESIQVTSRGDRYRNMLLYRFSREVSLLKAQFRECHGDRLSQKGYDSIEIEKTIYRLFSIGSPTVKHEIAKLKEHGINAQSYLSKINRLSVQKRIGDSSGFRNFILNIEMEPLSNREVEILAERKADIFKVLTKDKNFELIREIYNKKSNLGRIFHQRRSGKWRDPSYSRGYFAKIERFLTDKASCKHQIKLIAFLSATAGATSCYNLFSKTKMEKFTRIKIDILCSPEISSREVKYHLQQIISCALMKRGTSVQTSSGNKALKLLNSSFMEYGAIIRKILRISRTLVYSDLMTFAQAAEI